MFISHRSTDKEIADMLLDFFLATGLPKDLVFCSSLPGNDINCKIFEEIKQVILSSAINIVILSNDFYQSAYCLNEEGILWFQDTPVIVIAMPEISSSNMLGFLNSEYKLRYLDNEDDIASIYDKISETFFTTKIPAATLTYAMNKLKSRYKQYIETRDITKSRVNTQAMNEYDEITTDDERVILYYLLSKKVRKVSDTEIKNWFIDNEIYNINIENAFDLLSATGWGSFSATDTSIEFELEITHFRILSKMPNEFANALKETTIQYCRLSKDRFIEMCDTVQFDKNDLLFISYIRDENISSFGSRWMADRQIESIKSWESKFNLNPQLSDNYRKCLNKFVENNFVFASSWTSWDNPREYTLHKSIKTYFFSKTFPYGRDLEANKTAFCREN
jgi:hypothetical protein